MTDQKPLSPFALTPPRITILVLGVLAVVMIVGAISGGVTNHEALKEAAQDTSSASSSEAPSSSAP